MRGALDDVAQLGNALGQGRRTGLKDIGGFDFVDLAVLHCRHVVHPGLATMRSFLTGLPHHDPMITSGARSMTCSFETMRSLARPAPASSGNIGSPPAISISSSVQ